MSYMTTITSLLTAWSSSLTSCVTCLPGARGVFLCQPLRITLIWQLPGHASTWPTESTKPFNCYVTLGHFQIEQKRKSFNFLSQFGSGLFPQIVWIIIYFPEQFSASKLLRAICCIQSFSWFIGYSVKSGRAEDPYFVYYWVFPY